MLKPAVSADHSSHQERTDRRLIVTIVVAAAVLVLMPMLVLFHRSIYTESGELILENYQIAFEAAVSSQVLYNTLVFAIGSALIALVVGFVLAWLVARTNVPFKGMLYLAGVTTIIVPSLLNTMSWIFILSPRIGVFNTWAKMLLHTDTAIFNIYSLTGMIWVEALNLIPLSFLMLSAGMKNVDPALEDAGFTSGAGFWTVNYQINFKILTPMIFSTLLLSLVRGIEAFEVPALIGMPGKIYTLSSRIYILANRFPPDLGVASANAVMLLVITTIGIYFYSRVTRSQGKYATVSGKGYQPRIIDLGGARYPLAVGMLLFFFILFIAPFLILLWTSLLPIYEVPSWEALAKVSLVNFKELLAYPVVLRALRNSLVLSVVTATVVMVLTAIAAWISVRSSVRGRWIVDALISVPVAMPGIVVGIALLITYVRIPLPIYNTIVILIIAYLIKRMPYGLRYVSGTLVQINKELEEAAYLAGAGRATTFRVVVWPLLRAGVTAGWLYIAVTLFREFETSLMVYSPGNEVVSVMLYDFWDQAEFGRAAALGVISTLIVSGVVLLAISRLGWRALVDR